MFRESYFMGNITTAMAAVATTWVIQSGTWNFQNSVSLYLPRPIAIAGSPSIGIAQFVPGETPTEWLARADAAMYRAKQAGRNRVELATSGMDDPADMARRAACEPRERPATQR